MQWKKKTECYHWTWKAKLIFTAVAILLLYFTITNIYYFLSPQKEVQTNVLVVEGWLNDDALQESLTLFNSNHYEMMIVTGGPLNTGYIITNYKSTADMARQTLLMLGGDSSKIIAVSRKLVWRDRTYTTALALKKYFQKEMPHLKAFNLVSQGAHSRRSWLLFKKAMPAYDIGIISTSEKLYKSDRWWKTSKGFRTVFTETIGYFYVLFFF